MSFAKKCQDVALSKRILQKRLEGDHLKVAFDDDRQIVEAHIYKRYTERPFVRVQLEEVDGNE